MANQFNGILCVNLNEDGDQLNITAKEALTAAESGTLIFCKDHNITLGNEYWGFDYPLNVHRDLDDLNTIYMEFSGQTFVGSILEDAPMELYVP